MLEAIVQRISLFNWRGRRSPGFEKLLAATREGWGGAVMSSTLHAGRTTGAIDMPCRSSAHGGRADRGRRRRQRTHEALKAKAQRDEPFMAVAVSYVC